MYSKLCIQKKEIIIFLNTALDYRRILIQEEDTLNK